MAISIASPKKTGVKVKPAATATTTVEHKSKGAVISEKTASEKVDLTQGTQTVGASEPFAEVGIDAGYTHNLGDFKSARVGVSLRVPCLVSEIDEAFTLAEGWVNKKLESMIEDIVG